MNTYITKSHHTQSGFLLGVWYLASRQRDSYFCSPFIKRFIEVNYWIKPLWFLMLLITLSIFHSHSGFYMDPFKSLCSGPFIRINYIKAKINNMQQNSKIMCVESWQTDKNETVNHIMGKYSKLTQKDNMYSHDW